MSLILLAASTGAQANAPDTFSAVIAQPGPTGEITYGPSDSPFSIWWVTDPMDANNTILRDDLAQGDVFWVTSVSHPSISVSPQPGGTLIISTSGTPAGTHFINWQASIADPTYATSGSKTFSVS